MPAWRSRKTLLFLIPVAALAGIGAVAYFGASASAAAGGDEEELQTATARRGDLSLVATGTGTLIPATEVELGFDTSGELAQILVAVGDEVEAGQVLARLDPTSAETALAEVEAALREMTSPLAVAQAHLAVADAQEALESAQYTYTVRQEGHRATQDTIEGAKARLAEAKESLASAKGAYDRARGSAEKARAYDRYASAKSSYNSALATYNWYTGHPTEIQQAQLEADVAIAEARLAEAQALVAALTGQQLPEGASGSGLTALQKAQAGVAAARQNLESTDLRATLGGTITAINGTVGETVGGSSVMTLMDLRQPHVEFFLDQTDIDKASDGLEVEVTFDAYPDVVYSGTVTGIDPVLTTSGGVSAVHGFAALTPQAGEGAPRLLVGLSAAVDVIAGRVENAVLVPIEALRQITPGTYAVFVVDSAGALEMRMVEVGLQDETFAAITSGLEAGEIVSTGIVEVNA
ncbi:MAG: HlyD protein [Anaerolineales bacterium]|nr:HlyD protein [Anaerolineales bacterium]